MDSGFSFFAVFVHLGFCCLCGGGFFGLNASSWLLVCFSRFSVFVAFWGVGGCGVKTGIFRRICGVDGCGKVSGVWESFVDVQDRGVGGCS